MYVLVYTAQNELIVGYAGVVYILHVKFIPSTHTHSTI